MSEKKEFRCILCGEDVSSAVEDQLGHILEWHLELVIKLAAGLLELKDEEAK